MPRRRRTRARGLALTLPGGAALVSAALLVFAGSGSAAAESTPTNSSKPTISGTAQEGQTLQADPGTWTPSPNAYQYSWARCDSDGNNCSSPIGTSQNYQATSSDVGHTLRVWVSASTDGGASWSAPEASHRSGVITASGTAPSNTSPPTISGTAQDNQTLSVDKGKWSGSDPITYTYDWQRCDSSGNNCSSMGQHSDTYTVTSHDVGHRLRVKVTATNGVGSNDATSSATDVATAAGSAPVNTSLPSITGTLQDNSTLTGSAGKWTGTSPITYTYDWRRCDTNGNNCSSIASATTTATATTYRASSKDTGHRLRLIVTAKNGSGSATTTSAATAVVGAAGAAPKNTVLPTINGTAQDNQTLSAIVGTWTSTTPITYGYQWYRCDANGNNCAGIGGATAATYRVTSSDVGHRLRVTVTAKNAAGSIWATSPPTAIALAAGSAGGGAIKLPNGKTSIPVTSVSLPNRMIIDQLQFSPPRIGSRTTPIVARFHVSDSNGNAVRDALVYAVGVPANRVSKAAEVKTAQDGWATITFVSGRALPFRKGALVTIFVRARKAGENVLGGVSTRRLVSIRVSPV
jgi:hypothetical protein